MRRILLLCCAVFPLIIFGQKITVLDKISQSPIDLVYVYDENRNKTTSTDVNGIVDISIFEKSDSLFFQHPTYKTKEIAIKNGLVLSLVFLEPIYFMIPAMDITATRSEASVATATYSTKILESKTARLENPQTSADLLQQSGQVLVQKSQMGGGSPIIRGFEANRILLVVDGVRMNNAIYRSGHLQNAITVDNQFLESTEIVFGPSSVIYGSDALGGVVHFKTKEPRLSLKEGETKKTLNVFLRSASANSEKTGHLDFQVGGKKLGWIFSITRSEFDDLRMGRKRAHGYQDWGIVTNYVQPGENGEDLVFQNTNLALQPHTAYDQVDLGQKLLYKPSDSIDVSLNIQYSRSSDIPRFDRMNDLADGLPKFAEWKYGPQKRLFSAIEINVLGNGNIYDKASVIAAYQRIGEQRINRRLNDPFRFDRNEDVEVQSLNIDLNKNLDKKGTLLYGLELVNNEVVSESSIIDLSSFSGTPMNGPTRYPDGGSSMQTYSVYLNWSRVLNERSTFNTGIRYAHTFLDAKYVDTTFYQLPYDEIEFNNGALTGSLGLNRKLKNNYELGALVSTGFKSPNVDDATKIFEKDGFVVIPNDNLKPEYALNGELSLRKFWNEKQSWFNITGYYTRLFDAIVRRDTKLNGASTIIYEGEEGLVQTNMNTNEAEIYGFFAELNWEINNWFRWQTTFNYTEGTDLTDDIPLAHIPPVYGKSELKFYDESLSGAFYAYYNGNKKFNDLAPGTTDNPAEASPEGYPSWYTLNLRVSRILSHHFSINFALENILDHHYKQFASGLSASGRNLIFSGTFNF